MITKADYQKNFSPNEIPAELSALLDFQNAGNEWYSGRFELQASSTESLLGTYSAEKDFLDAFAPIAQTTSSGTTVAFWICEANKKLAEQPIVIFGDEGGFSVIFENLNDLLRYLTHDTEIRGSDADSLKYVSADYQPSSRKEEYVKWLKENFNLDAVTPAEIESAAKRVEEKYGVLFTDWMKKYTACE